MASPSSTWIFAFTYMMMFLFHSITSVPIDNHDPQFKPAKLAVINEQTQLNASGKQELVVPEFANNLGFRLPEIRDIQNPPVAKIENREIQQESRTENKIQDGTNSIDQTAVKQEKRELTVVKAKDVGQDDVSASPIDAVTQRIRTYFDDSDIEKETEDQSFVEHSMGAIQDFFTRAYNWWMNDFLLITGLFLAVIGIILVVILISVARYKHTHYGHWSVEKEHEPSVLPYQWHHSNNNLISASPKSTSTSICKDENHF